MAEPIVAEPASPAPVETTAQPIVQSVPQSDPVVETGADTHTSVQGAEPIGQVDAPDGASTGAWTVWSADPGFENPPTSFDEVDPANWSLPSDTEKPAPSSTGTGGWDVMPPSSDRTATLWPDFTGLNGPAGLLPSDRQADSDSDGTPNVHDYRPYDPFDSTTKDSDGDGRVDSIDNQPTTPYDSGTRDLDGDSIADRMDNRPTSRDD